MTEILPKQRTDRLLSEVSFKATTSGGKGGQNVNKVATRIELYFDIEGSSELSREEKDRILSKLSGKISDDGTLRITSSEARTQYQNKQQAQEKFIIAISKALKQPKKRKPTKPTELSKEARIREKKLQSEKKRLREKPDE